MLPEWKTGATSAKDIAQNKTLMFKVMELAQIQLHQGRHSASNRYDIGDQAYKKRVKDYLAKINENAMSHFAGVCKCQDCSGKEQAGKYPPRDNTVRYVDKASELIKGDINGLRIFVSSIAAEFAQCGGFILER